MNDANGTHNAYRRCVVLSSEGMHELASNIVGILNRGGPTFKHVRAECDVFANGELKPWVPETVRGEHVFVLHALQDPNPNSALIHLLLMGDALKRGSVAGITYVVPYIVYLRQDRKDKPRVPISARVVADIIETNDKVERIITLDTHVDQEMGFFNIPVDNINAATVHAEFFRKKFAGDFRDVVVVSPDVGGAGRARRFAQKMHEEIPVSMIDKRRTGPNKSEVLHFIGASLEGKCAIIYDDMIDTGGTIRGAAKEILNLGARSVYTCATHGIFSNNAELHFMDADNPVVIAETIPRSEHYKRTNDSWLSFVPIDELLAEAIRQASLVGGSVSKLS